MAGLNPEDGAGDEKVVENGRENVIECWNEYGREIGGQVMDRLQDGQSDKRPVIKMADLETVIGRSSFTLLA